MSLFLTDIERDTIFTYKSKTRDASLSTRLLGFFWEYCSLLVPASVAPNVLSFAGLLVQIYAFIFSLQFHSSPDEVQPQHFVIFVLCLAFQAFCAVDGIHARNIDNVSPLGELVNVICEGLGIAFLVLTMSNTLYLPADVTVCLLYAASLLSVCQCVSSLRCGVFVHHPLLGPGEMVLLTAMMAFSGRLSVAASEVTLQSADAFNRTLHELNLNELGNDVTQAVRDADTLFWSIPRWQFLGVAYVALLVGGIIYIVYQPLLPTGHQTFESKMPVSDTNNESDAGRNAPKDASSSTRRHHVRLAMRRPGVVVALGLLHMPLVTWALNGGRSSTLPVYDDGRFEPYALVALAAIAGGQVMLQTELTLCRMAPTRTLHPVAVLLLLAALLHPAVGALVVLLYFIDVLQDLSRSLHLPILTPLVNVYVNGVYDMCHLGHMNLFLNALSLGNRLVVGVHSDEDVAAYKRFPIMTLDERAGTVEKCKGVSRVIRSAPLVTTEQFVREHQIHRVAVSPEYDNPSDIWYADPRKMGIVVPLPRTDGISTSDIMRRILRRAGELDPDRKQSAAPDAARAREAADARRAHESTSDLVGAAAAAADVASNAATCASPHSPPVLSPARSVTSVGGGRTRTRTPNSQ